MNEVEDVAYYQSPLGIILLKANKEAITIVSFQDAEPASIVYSNSSLLQNAVQQLDEYFRGTRRHFELPLAPAGTDFQQSVWKELVQLSFGTTITYLQLAKRLGNVKSIRAAASANGKNPLAIIIPCHRVIGADGKLTGYAGGLHRKQWLLEHEARVCGSPVLFPES
ncbi:methylated-DNA--[protein]-cysteine S-methyltransferase [Lacibacter sp. MH-610]|uniref:methylated-DNA--[protein]-cysteine S-methyltransferase n=1 Tax=Lacibacter sp. MH-610 TaxID=3020883 RepID=UPI0038928A0D